MAAVGELLSGNTTLTHLDCSHTNMTGTGTLLIAHGIRANNSLVVSCIPASSALLFEQLFNDCLTPVQRVSSLWRAGHCASCTASAPTTV